MTRLRTVVGTDMMLHVSFVLLGNLAVGARAVVTAFVALFWSEHAG